MRLLTISLLVASVFASQAHATTASYYANNFNGRKTANGETFSNQKLTCASNKYSLCTYVEVTNPKNNKSVICKVNDRIGKSGRIDLSQKAFKELAPLSAGIVKVEVKPIQQENIELAYQE